MKIQPEHIRRAHVETYASETKFKLGVMLLLWVIIALGGCASTLIELEERLMVCENTGGDCINERFDYKHRLLWIASLNNPACGRAGTRCTIHGF